MRQIAELQQFQRKVIDLEFKVKNLVILIRGFFVQRRVLRRCARWRRCRSLTSSSRSRTWLF
jgi:hypothetical protein